MMNIADLCHHVKWDSLQNLWQPNSVLPQCKLPLVVSVKLDNLQNHNNKIKDISFLLHKSTLMTVPRQLSPEKCKRKHIPRKELQKTFIIFRLLETPSCK